MNHILACVYNLRQFVLGTILSLYLRRIILRTILSLHLRRIQLTLDK